MSNMTCHKDIINGISEIIIIHLFFFEIPIANIIVPTTSRPIICNMLIPVSTNKSKYVQEYLQTLLLYNYEDNLNEIPHA
jgi:hypothetical protein